MECRRDGNLVLEAMVLDSITGIRSRKDYQRKVMEDIKKLKEEGGGYLKIDRQTIHAGPWKVSAMTWLILAFCSR